MTNTCIAGSAADRQLVDDMEKGENLVLEVVDSSVQSVSTTLPLGQFASAATLKFRSVGQPNSPSELQSQSRI